MVSANDFIHARIFSFGIMRFISSLLMGFGALVHALLSRMWGDARDEAATGSHEWDGEGASDL